MPSFNDFKSTKKYRDYLISKTINSPDGPQTFTEDNYSYSVQSVGQNVQVPEITYNRDEMLGLIRKYNVYEPEEYFIYEELNTLPPTLNLGTYPHFEKADSNLVSIIKNQNFEKESELFKLSVKQLKDSSDGFVSTRNKQYYNKTVLGNSNYSNIFTSQQSTVLDILRGNRELVNLNYSITVPKDGQDKIYKIEDIVTGIDSPFVTIPGNYLTDPRKVVYNRPKTDNELTNIWQDVTGVIGESLGIERRLKWSYKPSDILLDYMGEGQKQVLFRNIGFSKYGPNYTTSARSQNSSALFGVVDTLNQISNDINGLEAPFKYAYIGDDRSNNVLYATNDINGRKIRSPYHLSMLFDEEQTRLMHNEASYTNKGNIYGNLIWISRNSKNKIGLYNKSWESQASTFNEFISTNYSFREDSIMNINQQILDSMPLDGIVSRRHVGNVMDQTSRYFMEGDKVISRASAVKYIDKNGVDVGEEFCRVFTKDRPHMTYADTMRRWENIRRYDSSVLGGGSRPWNLNYAPMSDGKKSFDNSTNIKKNSNGDWVAKKYMFSIENLAWKTSNIPGYTYNDLPYAERGPNGGRVMWFPPYDLGVSDNISVNWSDATFIGRPEAIYNYNNTKRTGTIDFKVLVDHPSILNLLVREHFDNMSDEEADNYITSFFAGCHELDFYSLIQRYTTLDTNDIELITQYLNDKVETEMIKKVKSEVLQPIIKEKIPDTIVSKLKDFGEFKLLYPNDTPQKGSSDFIAPDGYDTYYNAMGNLSDTYINNADSKLVTIVQSLFTSNTPNNKHDRKILFNTESLITDVAQQITYKEKLSSDLKGLFAGSRAYYNDLTLKIDEIIEDIKKGEVQEIGVLIESSCSAIADVKYNSKLSVRRSNAIIQFLINKLKTDGATVNPKKWGTDVKVSDIINLKRTVTFEELGYETKGSIIFSTTSRGEKVVVEGNVICTKGEFKNKELSKHAPGPFVCRQSSIKIKYNVANVVQVNDTSDDVDLTPKTRLNIEAEEIVNAPKKPKIDVMKRIIMKTLSEGYYFKKLEENSPLIYNSIKEKLKYFHPAFHSMTPEGLNARLNFLMQCGHSGDTLPIKGITDEADMVARNTSFGTPPICVIRIGDFYHSKIIINSMSISYDEAPWDINPEGVGVQPMIAKVNLGVTFIGGQGLEKPVEKLQNALSSNFFANTEMYDERSVGTNESIAGIKQEQFTKEFLEELMDLNNANTTNRNLNNKTDEIVKGETIGTGTDTLDYNAEVEILDRLIVSYYTEYQNIYNKLLINYGSLITSFLMDNHVRTVNTYEMHGLDTFKLLGVNTGVSSFFNKGLEKLKVLMLEKLTDNTLPDIIGYRTSFNNAKLTLITGELLPIIRNKVTEKLTTLIDTKPMENITDNRNTLIGYLDRVNFMLKNGFDCSIKDNDYVSVHLDGFDSNLNDTVKPLINTIVINNKKIEKVMKDEFIPTTITDTQFVDILSSILGSDFKFNSNKLTTDDINKLSKILSKFTKDTKEYDFKFNLKNSRKSKKTLTYKVISTDIVTDSNLIKEMQCIFDQSINNRGNILNYYRYNG